MYILKKWLTILSLNFKMTNDLVHLKKLHKRAFPADYVRDFSTDKCWLMTDYNKLVGFCSLYVCDKETVFLSRTGIFVNKMGYHRKAIQYRDRWCVRNGYKYIVTYVSEDNYPCIVNMIKCGYKFYTPAWDYAGPDFHYFIKQLF